MANSFLAAQTIARTTLGLLQREIVLPNLVWQNPIASFSGQLSDTVSVRLPARLTARDYEWRTRSTAITVDDLAETKVDVSLDTHLYSAVQVTDEELTLSISTFGEQVLAPQVRSVAERLENKVAAEMTGADYLTSHEITLDTTEPFNTAVDARALLNLQNVPQGDRALVLGANMESAFLKSQHFNRADQSGSDSALREALIGRVAGFPVFVSNALPANTGIAFHRTAFVLSTAAPQVPDGVTYGSRQSHEGLAMRWIRDYDAQYLRDRSIVSTFMGTNHIPDLPDDADADATPEVVRAVKITM